MKAKLLEKNVLLLPPLLQKRILDYISKRKQKRVFIEDSAEGPICKYKIGKKEYRITSLKPQREAELWCGNLHLDDVSALFVYGCGFGYGMVELLKRKQPNTIVFIFEENMDIFIEMLRYFDLSPFIQSQKFIFFVGELEDFLPEFQQVFWTDILLYSTAPSVIFTPIARTLFKEEYGKIHMTIFETLGLSITYLGNDHYDTLLGFHNIIKNLPAILHNPYLSCLQGQFKDKPAIIVSNGPSLDQSIKELKKVKGRGILFCSESAILPLMREGIVPDVLCVLERGRESYTYHFQNQQFPEEMALLALSVVDKDIFPAFSGPKIPIFRLTESINQWINSTVGDGSGLNAGANVSHLAFELAVYLGANPIIFVGQDFAFGKEGETHSQKSIYARKDLREHVSTIKSRPVVYLEANEGGTIPSTQLWADFKQGLEQKISSYPHVKVINSTAGGAKIQGAQWTPLSDVINQYVDGEIPVKISDIIRQEEKRISRKSRMEKLQRLDKEMAEYAREFTECSRRALQGQIRCRKAVDLLAEEPVNVENLESLYIENGNEFNTFKVHNLQLCFLQQVLVRGFHQLNRLGLIDSLGKIQQVFAIHEELFYHLNITCQSIAVNFEMAREKMLKI